MAVEIDLDAMAAERRNMVDGQVRPSDVTRPEITDAMLWAPREVFAPKAKRAVAYLGDHLPIAPGRFELEPRILGKMFNILALNERDLTLVVGSAYGYAAAIASRLCAAVVALEEDEAMSASGADVLSALNIDTVVSATGPLAAGWPEHAPYNAIFVNGALGRATPEAWADQLADGGRIVLVRDDGVVGRCEIGVKSGGAVGYRAVFDAMAPILPGFEAEAGFQF